MMDNTPTTNTKEVGMMTGWNEQSVSNIWRPIDTHCLSLYTFFFITAHHTNTYHPFYWLTNWTTEQLNISKWISRPHQTDWGKLRKGDLMMCNYSCTSIGCHVSWKIQFHGSWMNNTFSRCYALIYEETIIDSNSRLVEVESSVIFVSAAGSRFNCLIDEYNDIHLETTTE